MQLSFTFGCPAVASLGMQLTLLFLVASGKKAIPPAVQQVFNVLLQPGSSYGCTGTRVL